MVGQVNGRSYIRLGIKSAIVSCLSMNSPTPMPIRAIPSHPGRASCVRVLGARTLLREGGGREGRKEEGKSRGKKKKESGRLRGLYVVMYKEGCFAVYPREVTWKKNANVAKKVALSFASTRKREGKTRSIEKSELETVVDSNRGNSDIFDHRYYRWMDFDPRFGKFDLNRRVIFSG